MEVESRDVAIQDAEGEEKEMGEGTQKSGTRAVKLGEEFTVWR